MADHGLDLDALQAHGHSIYGPSSSAMWLFCSGSLIPHIQAPDNAGEDAAYGTVGHAVGEEWLNRIKTEREAALQEHDPDPLLDDEFKQLVIDRSKPEDWIGRTITIHNRTGDFPITIDEEMLAYVREYVEWCFELPGEHYIETKVSIADLTPIPKQAGTADHAACLPGVLTVADLKMGRIIVYAKHNTQALLYAWGFFTAYDEIYQFERIVIRIAQPRMEHFDTWEISRSDLIAFATWAKVQAYAAWEPDAPRTPGKKQCQWCHVSDTCAARLAWLLEDTDDVFDDLTISEDGSIEGVSYTVKEIQQAEDDFLSGEREIAFRDPGSLSTAAMAKLLPMRKVIEKMFAGIEAELQHRAENGETIPGYKLVDGREGNREWVEGAAEHLQFMGIDDPWSDKLKSPAQIEEYLHEHHKMKKSVAKEILSDLTFRRAGRKTLAPVQDLREEVQSLADSSFDNLEDDGL